MAWWLTRTSTSCSSCISLLWRTYQLHYVDLFLPWTVWSTGSNEAREFLGLSGATASECHHLKTHYSCAWGAAGVHRSAHCQHRTLGRDAVAAPGVSLSTDHYLRVFSYLETSVVTHALWASSCLLELLHCILVAFFSLLDFCERSFARHGSRNSRLCVCCSLRVW